MSGQARGMLAFLLCLCLCLCLCYAYDMNIGIWCDVGQGPTQWVGPSYAGPRSNAGRAQCSGRGPIRDYVFNIW